MQMASDSGGGNELGSDDGLGDEEDVPPLSDDAEESESEAPPLVLAEQRRAFVTGSDWTTATLLDQLRRGKY
jgi:hypothetical protein